MVARAQDDALLCYSTDDILLQLIPSQIVDALKDRRNVEPESHECDRFLLRHAWLYQDFGHAYTTKGFFVA